MRGLQWLRWLAALWIVTLASVAAAQTRASTAELAGRVVDRTAAVLPGAVVTARHTATAVSRETVTDADGRFVLPGLAVGAYTISVQLSQFAPASLDVTLAVGDRLDVNVVLDLAGVTSQVTVEGDGRAADVRKTSVSSVIGGPQIQSLPINGRSFMSFAQLTAGVTADRGLAAQGGSGLSFTGLSGRANNVSLDGLDNNDVNLRDVRGTLSQEAVEEFQVLTSTYAAEFGKASGGVVNIVSRSGTNTHAGSAFLFYRDKALNGRAAFEDHDAAGQAIDRPKAPFNQRQFGFTAGGPIVRERLFYFGAFERQATDTAQYVSIDDQTIVMHPFAPVPLGTAASILRQAGFDVATGYQPAAFAQNQYFAKVDRHAGGRNWIAGRVHGSTRDDDQIEPFGGLVAKSHGATLHAADVQAAGWWLHAPSDRWLNDLRVQFARDVKHEYAFDPKCAGLCDLDTEGGPAADVLGWASVGRNPGAPSSSDFRYLQVLDTLSAYRGRHQWKAGFDAGLRWITDNHFPLNFGGRYVFASLPASVAALFGLPGPVSAIQAVAIGLPVVYVQGYGTSDAGSSRSSDLSLFVQDDWQVRPDLTIKAGLRYQLQSFAVGAFTVPGVSESYDFPKDRNDVGPRVGLAWAPRGSRTTLVRGAYSLAYDRTLTSLEGTATVLNPVSGVRTLVAQGALPIAAWQSPGRRLPESAVGTFPSTTIAVDPDLRTPYAHQWSVGLDRELRPSLRASATGVFVRGSDSSGVLDYNPLVPALGSGRRPLDLNGQAGTSASVLQYTSYGETGYEGLLLSLEKRFQHGSQWLASYTWSKADDDLSDFTSQPNASGTGRNPSDPNGLPIGFDPASERGPSPRDQRHRLVLSGFLDLPHGFQLSAIVAAASGRPYNVIAGQDLNGDGNPDTDRPRTVPSDPATVIRRNDGRLPAESSTDVRLTWHQRVGGAVAIDWMLDVFNLFDRTNYTDVNAVFGAGAYPGTPSPGFGQFTQAGPPRQVQLGARLRF